MKSANDIADDVVVVLNAIVDPTFAFTAVNPGEGVDIYREDGGNRVQVLAYDETEESIDRGYTVNATRTVSVLVAKPFDDATLGQCLTWLNEIKAALVGVTLDDGWLWDNNETTTLYDLEAAQQRRHFVSLFRVRFRTYA